MTTRPRFHPRQPRIPVDRNAIVDTAIAIVRRTCGAHSGSLGAIVELEMLKVPKERPART